jgi:hypothetical protein
MCGLRSSCQTSLFSFPEARYTFTRHLESIPYLPGLMQTNYAVTTSKHVNLLRFWQSLQTKSCRFVSFFATNNSVSNAIHFLCLLGLSCTPTSFFWTRGEGAMKENFLQQLANFGFVGLPTCRLSNAQMGQSFAPWNTPYYSTYCHATGVY